MKDIIDVVLKPVISEKSFNEAKMNKYTFRVARNASKIDIKRAVEKLFNVKVKSVFTSKIAGSKTKMTKYGKRNWDVSYKKARALLEKGQKIDIFEEKTK